MNWVNSKVCEVAGEKKKKPLLTPGKKGGKDEQADVGFQRQLIWLQCWFQPTVKLHSYGTRLQAAALIHARGVQSGPSDETVCDKN